MAFGIDEGPSTQENQQYQNLSGLSGTEANLGLSDINQSNAFMSAILSGDPTKIATVLAPQIKASQDQAQQQKNQLAQFGNRSGGATSAAANIDTASRANYTDLIGQLTGQAATSLGQTGLALTGQAQSGFGTSFDQAAAMQQQRASKITDLLKSIASTVTGVVGGIGNLDTTGGSSFGEQVMNFAGGF